MNVLLVDDNGAFRVTMGAVLEDAGHRVAEAGSLQAARACLAAAAPFDVALVDGQLGDGHGSELIPEIRRLRPAARVILLTGSAGPRGGADLVIEKGEDPDSIVRRLEELARGAR